MPLSSLAPLAGLGSAFGEVSDLAQKQRQMQIRETLAALQAQQLKQQQQAQAGIGSLLGSGQLNSLMGGQGPQQPGGGGGALPQLPQIPQQGGAMGPPPQQPPELQAGTFGGMGSGLQQPQAMKASWFGNAPGWSDPSDSGLQAGGQPVSAGPGIALPSRSTLGQQFNVTTPDGRTFTEPQTDIGPAKWTGRGVDINARAAEQMGYTPKTFPTDAVFKVALANTSPQTQALAGAGTQQAARQIPNILQTAGSWNMDGLAKLIEKTNPDADPEVKGAIFLKMAPLLNKQAKEQAANIFKTYQTGEHQYEFDTSKRLQEKEFGIRQADTEAMRAQTAEFQRLRLAQGEQRVPPQTQAFDAFMKQNPNATPEEQQQFIQTGRPARSGQSAAVQKFMSENPNATADQIAAFTAQTAAQVSATRAFDSGPQGNITRSINVAVDHLAVLEDAGKGLENTPIQYVNKIANEWAKETGQPPPTDFNAVKSIVKDELVKAVLGGVGALGDRQEIEGTINAANSPAQLQGVITRYMQLMGGQARGLQQQFVTSKAGTEKDFQEKLFPRTRSALSEAGSPGRYPTPASVYEAYQSGKLPQDQAQKILKDQFGVGGDAGTQP